MDRRTQIHLAADRKACLRLLSRGVADEARSAEPILVFPEDANAVKVGCVKEPAPASPIHMKPNQHVFQRNRVYYATKDDAVPGEDFSCGRPFHLRPRNRGLMRDARTWNTSGVTAIVAKGSRWIHVRILPDEDSEESEGHFYL